MLDPNSVRSVDRAAAIMIALGDARGDTGVTELARTLGLHKSTASRLLATLQGRGLVERDEDSGKYRLGVALIRLGTHAERILDLRGIAMSELETLSRSVHETTALGILRGDTALTVAYSDPYGTARDRTGRRLPLHATAPGKVLLAAQPEREVIRLARAGFTPFTNRTIVRVDALLEELARIRACRFATAFGEYDEMLSGVSVPVFDQRSQVVAALEIFAPGNRVTPTRLPGLIDRAREAAAAIMDRIGGVAR
jgi:DNA-binding IclR family transcriptional regulator